MTLAQDSCRTLDGRRLSTVKALTYAVRTRGGHLALDRMLERGLIDGQGYGRALKAYREQFG